MSDTVILASKWFQEHSKSAIRFLDHAVPAVIPIWITVLSILIVLKLLAASVVGEQDHEIAVMVLPFLLAVIAPVAGYRVATAAFPTDALLRQPSIRLCRYGKWRSLDLIAARQDHAYGPEGLMASLAGGILLNVPFRTVEFMLAMPPMSSQAPGWASTMMAMMTLDLVTMNFLYMVCFVLALRAVPYFPRFLVLAWTLDVCLQLAIAHKVAAQPMLPDAVATALSGLLHGNVEKVFISVALWLPYLILSRRVNVTYRQRVRC